MTPLIFVITPSAAWSVASVCFIATPACSIALRAAWEVCAKSVERRSILPSRFVASLLISLIARSTLGMV